MPLTRFVTFLLAAFLCGSQVSHAATQRMEAWGAGNSEFSAIKSAYKIIMADSLKLTVAGAGTVEGTIRRNMEREIEEDLIRTKRTFTPEAVERCSSEDAKVECQVIAPVKMDELEAWVRQQLGNSGQGGRKIGNISFALVNNSDSTTAKDFSIWLHSKLETDMGHDVYFAPELVNADMLRKKCEPLRALTNEYQEKGSSYKKTANAYAEKLRSCLDLSERDAILVLNDVSVSPSNFAASDSSMNGNMRLAFEFVQPSSSRPLPAPNPRAIKQVGYGGTASEAKTDLTDKLYETAANYVSQQFNNIVIAANNDQRINSDVSTYQYVIRLSGINSDLTEDRKKSRIIRNWFEDNMKVDLKSDVTQASFGEQVYSFSSSKEIEWTDTIDELYDLLDEEKIASRIDLDRDSNLLISFKNDSRVEDKKIVLELNERALRWKLKVEDRDMVLRRRDPATGISMALNEANVRIYNRNRKTLVVSVTPLWFNDEGVTIPSVFNEETRMEVKGKSSQLFVLRAPSRYATSVSLEVSCPEKDCVKGK